MSDPALSGLRCVKWELDGARAPRQELVPAGESELLVEAVLELHQRRGVNPHSGRPAQRLLYLGVGTARLDEGAWWSAPSLDEAAGPKARVVRWRFETRYEAPDEDGEALEHLDGR